MAAFRCPACAMEVREKLLRFVETMQRMLVDGARRRVLRGGLLLVACAGVAMGQVKAPRYQSPIEAPVPQPVALPAPPAITPNGTVVEDVIVRVNDQVINRSDVERSQRQLLEEAREENLSAAELAQRQKDMLRDMIDQQLLISRGKELDINPDAEVVRQLDAIRKQHNLDSMEALEKAVRETGISYEDFKANIRNGILQQQVVRDEVGRNLRLNAKSEQAYYDEHKQEYAQPEQVRLSEILIPVAADATDAQIAQGQAKADDVVAQLKAGAKFDELAKKVSGGTTAANGGDLGKPYQRGAMAQVFDDQTFKLPVGGITTPIRTRQGFVVLKVTEHIEAGVPPLKDIEEPIQEAMYHEALAPALRTYLTGLRENAYIDIAPGFVDSGASAKETKPVFAAATPLPVNKKKAAAQKQRLAMAKAAPAPVVPVASGSAGSTAGSGTAVAKGSTAKTVNVASGKKPKKIRREKVRFGQAPRNSLPSGPEETLAAGADQGSGATGVALPGGTMSSPDTNTTIATNDADPLARATPVTGKTRYSDRAATEAATKAAEKAAKIKEKAAKTPAPLTADDKLKQNAEDAPLGLNGDTASKKKKKKDKDAPKERLQDKAPTPAAKPEMTPLPPKSVRDNGEPTATPVSGIPPAPATDATTPAAPSK
jgi:peptidyl-prolyl cis-trans isomerase SurA